MSRHFNFKPLPAAIAIALGSGIAVQQTAQADAVVFPRIASGDGFATFIQLTNTANISTTGDATGAPRNSGGGPYLLENLRFVYNVNTALVTDSSGNVGLDSCTHIDLPGRTSSKDTMFFEVTSGTGQIATQLLPDNTDFGAEASVAARIAGPTFGSLAITNAWQSYEPQSQPGGATATGVWAGVGPGDLGEPNEGTLFGQAWVIDFANNSMTAYNGYNDPLEATTQAGFQSPAESSFNTNMMDQYLMQWLPTYGGAIVTTYHFFPFAFTSSYLTTTPPETVTIEIGRNLTNTQNNNQDGVSLNQDGFWDHKEEFISGIVTIPVPCGGLSVPLRNLVGPLQQDALQHTGGVAYANVAARNDGTTQAPNFVRDAALVLKQVDVVTPFTSLVAEPGAIHLDINSAGPAAAAKATPDAAFSWTH